MLNKLLPSTISLFGLVTILTILFTPSAAYPEEKVITAEASYLMGDGETPSFAEAMVLQKAKQAALEEAGTYVQSYTKAMNFDITTEEIQTITGGLLKTEILKKTRTLVGDGVRFDITIKAIVTAEKMEELARRIKGKNVAEEYGKLQGEYARLSKELEALKQALPKLSSGTDRESALDRLQGLEKSYRVLQQTEATLFERLVSGEALHSIALGQISRKENERHVADALFYRMLKEGHIISLGEPVIQASLKDRNYVTFSVPVTLQAGEEIKTSIEDTARSLGGSVLQATYESRYRKGMRHDGVAVTMGTDPETVGYFQHRVASLVFVLEAQLKEGVAHHCHMSRFYNRFGASSDLDGPVMGINPATLRTQRTIETLTGAPFYEGRSQRIDENNGYVVIFDTPVHFTARMRIPVEDVKRITTLKGLVLEGRLEDISGSSSVRLSGVYSCH